MKETFLLRAKENIKAAEILFENELYNASANRAYYAAFHIAIYAIYSAGIVPTIDHKVVQTLFSDYYFNKRKILPSKFNSYLTNIRSIRNNADYKVPVSKKIAKSQLKDVNEFIDIILKVIK